MPSQRVEEEEYTAPRNRNHDKLAESTSGPESRVANLHPSLTEPVHRCCTLRPPLIRHRNAANTNARSVPLQDTWDCPAMNDDTTRIRLAAPHDMHRVLEIHRDAFGAEEGPVISILVRKTLAEPTSQPSLSMIAEKEKRLLGNVLSTAAKLDSCENAGARILAPLAVTHDQHGLGIGSELVKSGLAHLQLDAIDLGFFRGHSNCYSIFGFMPAGMRGFEMPHPILPGNSDA